MWGAKLGEFLHKLISERGHKQIFQTSDGRFADLEQDAMQKCLNEYFFKTQVKAGETFRNLDSLQESGGGQGGSLKYDAINKAAQAIFPQGKCRAVANRLTDVYARGLMTKTSIVRMDGWERLGEYPAARDDWRKHRFAKGKGKGVAKAVGQWSNSSRPDLSAWCFLLQERVSHAKIQDLLDANRLVKVEIWPRILLESSRFLQKRFISLFFQMLPGPMQLTSALKLDLWLQQAILYWLMAFNDGYTLEKDAEWAQKVPATLVDCKSAYDHVTRSTVSLKDKRMAIEMLLVKNGITAHTITLRWVATKQTIVDGLSK
eukprot:s194_g4.t1